MMDDDETMNYTYVGKFEMIIERIIGVRRAKMPDPLLLHYIDRM